VLSVKRSPCGWPMTKMFFAFADCFFLARTGWTNSPLAGFAGQPDQAQVEIFCGGAITSAPAPGAGSHCDQCSRAPPRWKADSSITWRAGDQQVAGGSGFEENACAEAVGRNFVVVETRCGAPGVITATRGFNASEISLADIGMDEGSAGKTLFGVEFAEALADDGGQGNEGDAEDGGDGGQHAADDQQRGEERKPCEAGARRQARAWPRGRSA